MLSEYFTVLRGPYKCLCWFLYFGRQLFSLGKESGFLGDRCYDIKSVFLPILKFTSTYCSQKKREILSHKNAAMLHIFIHSICIYRLPKCAKLSLKIKSGNILKNAAVKWIFNHIVKILLQNTITVGNLRPGITDTRIWVLALPLTGFLKLFKLL